MKLSASDVADFFTNTHVSITNNPRLREPQERGHAAAVAHFASGGGHALEQIPVGCGKCLAPGLMEASNPQEHDDHGCPQEVPR